MEVRASATNPSRIGDRWNPVVLEDLKTRLRRAGVDPNRTFVWVSRGPARSIERKRKVAPGQRLKWTCGPIRDRDILLPDAVAYVDWLRDRVAAHASSSLTRSLSPYDVFNAQSLARIILIEALGARAFFD